MDVRDEAQKAALLRRLSETPDDLGALVALGNLALRTGFRSAACTAYRRAIEIDGNDPAIRVNLGNALLEGGDFEGARNAYEGALRVHPGFAPAHQGLSYTYARLGDEASAQRHRDLGFTGNAVMRIPSTGNAAARRALVLVSAAGADFHTGALLDRSVFDVTKVFAEYADPLPEIAKPFTAINAIGDADRCKPALLAAQALLERHGGMRVLNDPQRVLQTGRLTIAHRLGGLDDVVTPRMALVRRTELRCVDFGYPLLVRTPGHHTGRHFVRIEHAGEVDEAIAALPGDELLAMEFLDVRNSDGIARKYRVLAIGGEIYPAHVAVSESWKVHFFTSGAAQSEAHRAEDARFLENPRAVLGERVLQSLRRIVDALQLDYMGIDFAIDALGRAVIFEANAAMSVYAVPLDARWDYRRKPTERIISAFSGLVDTSLSR